MRPDWNGPRVRPVHDGYRWHVSIGLISSEGYGGTDDEIVPVPSGEKADAIKLAGRIATERGLATGPIQRDMRDIP